MNIYDVGGFAVVKDMMVKGCYKLRFQELKHKIDALVGGVSAFRKC